MLSRDHFLVLTYLSIAVLSAAVWRLRGAELAQLEINALILLTLCFGLMLVQLLPLPQSLWSVMGGRAFIVDGLTATQQTDAWLTLSLSPEATRQDILALLPGAAMFIAMLSLSREGTIALVFSIAGLALLGLLLSIVQKTAALATGGFVNPNFFAAQLYMSIPFVIFLATRSSNKLMWILAGAIVLFCIIGIGQSGSRFGLFIGLGVAFTSALNSARVSHTFAAYGFMAATVLTVVVLLFGGAGLERIAGLQTALSARTQIFNTSLQALFSFLPVGSGFGSFVPVYQLFETPTQVTPRYVNHAHNDWVELLIEGGLFVAVLMVSFLRWFGQALYTAWDRNSELGKAAAISIFAVLLHSLADYPLRTPALLVLFACCCAVLARVAVPRKNDKRSEPLWTFEPNLTQAKVIM